MSPYISRGLISSREVYEHIKSLDIEWQRVEKLIQELAWRDYWQQLWEAKEELIFSDLKQRQKNVINHKIPLTIVNANTGISAIDEAIKELYRSGYMHNHMRMYVASICCNIADCHWLEPAKWMYSHLLDGDLASNHLSWQWVAGTNSNKKYFANQENINKFFYSQQKDTFLDVPYDQFEELEVPEVLRDLSANNFEPSLSGILSTPLAAIEDKETLIYNYYNLDPHWHKEEGFQRIFLLEPSVFEKYAVGKSCIDFAIELSKNVEGIKCYVGEFDDLLQIIAAKNITFKEHPLNKHYAGKEEARAWISSVKGDYSSFFAFWKKCKKELKW